MIKLKSMRLTKTISKLGNGGGSHKKEKATEQKPVVEVGEVKWELRPGGMLVQRRESVGEKGKRVITIKVSTVSSRHDISISPSSTFGELKILSSLVTRLEPKEQRLLFRGKERGDHEHLHMLGVGDKDKVLLLEDPAIKEAKLRNFTDGSLRATCHAIRV